MLDTTSSMNEQLHGRSWSVRPSNVKILLNILCRGSETLNVFISKGDVAISEENGICRY